MKFRKPRPSFRRSLGLIAVVAVVVGAGFEAFVILPREHPRLQLAEIHRAKSAAYSRMASSTSYQLSPELRRDFLGLSEWHRRRWDELRKASKFDPAAELQIEIKHEKVEDSIMMDYAEQTRSI